MGSNTNYFGDLTPRSAGAIARKLLDRAQAMSVTEPYFEVKPIPGKSGQAITFRRYLGFAVATVPLADGTPPAGKKLLFEDVTITIDEFGDICEITNRSVELHEDDIPAEIQKIMGEQVSETWETLRIAKMKAGTTVYYANGAARTDVNTPVSNGKLATIKRYLSSQRAKYYTSIIKAGQGFNTEPIESCYIAFGHTDLDWDIRQLQGFTPVEQYADAGKGKPGEMGKAGSFRFVLTEMFDSWADGGAAKAGSGTTMISTGNTSADVYPLIILAPGAICTTPLRGKNAITPFYVHPLKVSHSNKLGQKGHAGWRGWFGAGVLKEEWLVRLEVAATNSPT